MTNRTVVIRRKSFNWRQKTKRKIQPAVILKSRSAGYISPVLIVFVCAAFSGLFYVYLVNQTAVKGIEMRRAEKEIANQQKDNETLKIREAELKSLYHIEEQSKQLEMVNSTGIKYIEESPSVAYGNNVKEDKN
jgi:uncharacterized membrane protein (DUF106 family)